MTRRKPKTKAKRAATEVPPLQPLRIPPGWEVVLNRFHELDPTFHSEDDAWSYFSQDMLWIVQRGGKLGIDLDWLPDHAKSGRFVLSVVRLWPERERPPYDPWTRPLNRLETRSRRKVVGAIEKWLAWYGRHGVDQRS